LQILGRMPQTKCPELCPVQLTLLMQNIRSGLKPLEQPTAPFDHGRHRPRLSFRRFRTRREATVKPATLLAAHRPIPAPSRRAQVLHEPPLALRTVQRSVASSSSRIAALALGSLPLHGYLVAPQDDFPEAWVSTNNYTNGRRKTESRVQRSSLTKHSSRMLDQRLVGDAGFLGAEGSMLFDGYHLRRLREPPADGVSWDLRSTARDCPGPGPAETAPISGTSADARIVMRQRGIFGALI
jgi:hypothetical protein